MRILRTLVCATLATTIASSLLFSPTITTAQANSAETLLTYKGQGKLDVELIARYSSGAGFAESGTEIVVYNNQYNQLYSINGAEKSLDIVSLQSLKQGSSFTELKITKRIALIQLNKQTLPLDDITSVALHPSEQFIAITAPASPVTDEGYVIFLSHDGTYLSHVKVGVLPDMVTFTPDGKYALTANEAQPNADYSIDPVGSVSIIDVSGDIKALSEGNVSTVDFSNIKSDGIRIGKPGATFTEDAEPEYIVVSADSRKAYVALQESNAIATLDIASKTFESVKSLGTIDHSVPGFALDASDKDGVASLKNWPTLGLFMPDGMSIYQANGKTYILTANEGDAKDYDGFSEEARVADIADRIKLDASYYKGYSQAQLDEMQSALTDSKQLGRLKTTTSTELNADGTQSYINSYGTRSFSIWDADTMSLVYDSGDQFERIVKQATPHAFNTNHEVTEFDSRSDDKGVEPEGVTIGQIGDATYAFIGLERASGIMAYNISNPTTPVFDTYFSSRSYDLTAEQVSGDVGPEGLAFIDAKQSPTGEALLVVANEISGTLSVYEIEPSDLTRVNIIATNDIHSRVTEGDGMGYAKLATIVEQYRAMNSNTLVLDAGDTLHGQTFSTLVEGTSIIELMNIIGYDALTTGNHDYNYGLEQLLQLEEQASFPVLAANVLNEDGSYTFEPYVIKEVDGIKIGIFGLATPETLYKTHPKNVEGLTFLNPTETAKKMVAELEPQVDIIISLAHLGVDGSTEDENRSDKLLSQVKGIDLLIDGHSHTQINQTTYDTLHVQFGEYGKQVGVITLEFDSKTLVDKQAISISADDAKTISPNVEVKALIAKTSEAQNDILDIVIGSTKSRLEGERAVVRTGESNLGNLITDAMLHASGADIAFTNGGGIRASVEAGDITIRDIITVMPFGNFIVTIEVTGQELKDALEVGATGYPAAHGAFAHVAGISYQIDASKPVGERINNILYKQAPLNMNATYTLATNDFIAAGGDNFTMFADNTILNNASSLDEAVIAYIKEHGVVEAKVENRVSIIPTQVNDTSNGQTIQTYTVVKGDTLTKIAKNFNTNWRELQKLNTIKNANLIFPGQELKLQ